MRDFFLSIHSIHTVSGPHPAASIDSGYCQCFPWGMNLTIHLHLVLDQACMKLHLHSPPYILISQRDNFIIFFFTSSVRVGAHVTWPAARSLAQSGPTQCSRHTPARVSPLNFDTIHFILFSKSYS